MSNRPPPGPATPAPAAPRTALLPAALAAALAATACGSGGPLSQSQVSSPACGTETCDSALTYSAILPTLRADQLTSLTVTLCHNSLCPSRSPTLLADPARADCSFTGLLTSRCTLQPDGGGYQLRVTFAGPGSDYQPGDRFTIRVMLPPANTLLDVTLQAADLTDLRPNGPTCPPLCRTGPLT